jgi:hypothetical protein
LETTTVTHKSDHNRAQARLNRLPPMAQRLIKNRAAAREFIAIAPLARLMFAAGPSPEPDMGVAEFDAIISIIKDALGSSPLSDEEFERALRLSTPPECRETAQ